MAQYWYLGARVKESSAASNGRIRQHDVARWVNVVFESAEAAAAAAPMIIALLVVLFISHLLQKHSPSNPRARLYLYYRLRLLIVPFLT